VPKFRKKPVVVEAIITRLVIAEAKVAWHLLPQWIKDAYEAGKLVICDDAIYIATLEGSMRAEPSDWIIQGVKGELYPCKPDIFEQTYEQCSELETSPAQCDHSWVTSNFEAPRCLWCHVEKSAAETREEL
jgi:hypothetical protein